MSIKITNLRKFSLFFPSSSATGRGELNNITWKNLTVILFYDNITLLHKDNIYLIEYFLQNCILLLLLDKFCVATKTEREYVLGAYSFSNTHFLFLEVYKCGLGLINPILMHLRMLPLP